MIGSFLTRALALILGYAYPAYECFKTVELNRPEIEQLRFWCQYWILVAALTVFERVGDAFISWMPMYSEAKVAFFVYLWYPKTRGTTYIYETFLRPYVASHENEIDRNLLELKARAGDMIVLYWQKVAIYGQTRMFEIFQYIASQAPQQQTRSRPTVRQPLAVHHTDQVPPAPSASNSNQSAATPQQPLRSPESPAKRMSQEPARAVADPLPPAPSQQQQQQQQQQSAASLSDGTSQSSSTSDVEVIKIPAAAAAETAVVAADDSNRPAEATPIEEAIRMTRGRLRKRAGFALPAAR